MPPFFRFPPVSHRFDAPFHTDLIRIGNSGKYDHLPKEKNIYGAKLVCADCGARIKLHRSFSTKKDKVYFTFNCPTYQEHGKAGCSSRVKRKADLDEAVFQSIRAQMDVFMDTAHIIKSLLAQKQAINKGAARKKTKSSLYDTQHQIHRRDDQSYKREPLYPRQKSKASSRKRVDYSPRCTRGNHTS